MILIDKIISKANSFVTRFIISRLAYSPMPQVLEKIGSDYGGWVVPVDLMSGTSICYCVGVGEDVTFDVGLIERFGCSVIAFDPTPRAREFVVKNVNDERFIFDPRGVWRQDGPIRFYSPADELHVSHSIVNLQKTESYFEADCRRLAGLMAERGHTHLDLLKLDIEGAEFDVIDSIIEDNLDIKVFCFEFDQPASIWKLLSALWALHSWGMRLVNVDGLNFTLLKKELLGKSTKG